MQQCRHLLDIVTALFRARHFGGMCVCLWKYRYWAGISVTFAACSVTQKCNAVWHYKWWKARKGELSLKLASYLLKWPDFDVSCDKSVTMASIADQEGAPEYFRQTRVFWFYSLLVCARRSPSSCLCVYSSTNSKTRIVSYVIYEWLVFIVWMNQLGFHYSYRTIYIDTQAFWIMGLLSERIILAIASSTAWILGKNCSAEDRTRVGSFVDTLTARPPW